MYEAKMYFQSFLKLNSHLKIFLIIRVSNWCSISLSFVYLVTCCSAVYLWPIEDMAEDMGKKSQNNTSN